MNTYSTASFRTLGNAATAQNLFTILNTGTSRTVRIKKVEFSMDATVVLTAVSPLVYLCRIAAASGGTALNKVSLGQEQSSPKVEARGATASGGGAATAITATPGVTLWQAFCMRLHTAVGQVLGTPSQLIPDDNGVELAPGQGILVHIVAAAAGSNPATNHYSVSCLWEEIGA